MNDEKILIGGAVEKAANGYDFMAARIDTSGSLDLSFNTTGFITQNLVPGNVDEFANSMAVTADGRIVLSGTVEYGSAINEDVGLLLLKTDTTTGVPTLINPSFMEIFPNPSGDELTITVSKPMTLTISDVHGRILKMIKTASGANKISK
ncbi:MAG: hypothetical protein IPP71_10905 [Bacteroidetes bacterium]|nr:hypothetical protein [Bacteroidota bacterium]